MSADASPDQSIIESTTETTAAGSGPAVDQPVTEQPVTEQPVAEQPVADQPVADHTPAPGPTFAELGVDERICAALDQVGITRAFPIQHMTLPVALTGHDIIGQAKTGTGKTLGFGIPVLQRVVGPKEADWDDLEAAGKPQALVVVPTRELAVQVANDLGTASTKRSVRVLTVYGGRAYEPQIEALRKGIEVVVGTPGRLLDLAQQGHLTLAHARIVVLDEADEMLDLGFLPDVERILNHTPAGRQTMLFSATMPSAVVALARRFMTQPTHIRASEPDDTGATVRATKQFVYRAHALDKIEMVARILQARGRGLTMIFARTKRTVANVAEQLEERGFAAAAIHGDLGQGAREQALRAFRNGKVDVLVATDVAARGIDVDDVTHVINYACPEDEKTYLHRIGRTGRAGNTGVAVTFVDWDDLHKWMMINKTLDLGIPESVETYSSSPHLFTDLDIPESTRGTLPRASRTRAGLDAEVVEDLGETGRGGKGRSSGGGRDSGRDGGRSRRGGRDSGRDSGRDLGKDPGRDLGGPVDDAAAGPDVTDAPRPRRNRTRRRTVGGVAVARDAASPDGTPGIATPPSDTAPAANASVGGSPTETGPSATGPDGDAGTRRRRRRGGRGRGSRSEQGAAEAAAPAE